MFSRNPMHGFKSYSVGPRGWSKEIFFLFSQKHKNKKQKTIRIHWSFISSRRVTAPASVMNEYEHTPYQVKNHSAFRCLHPVKSLVQRLGAAAAEPPLSTEEWKITGFHHSMWYNRSCLSLFFMLCSVQNNKPSNKAAVLQESSRGFIFIFSNQKKVLKDLQGYKRSN